MLEKASVRGGKTGAHKGSGTKGARLQLQRTTWEDCIDTAPREDNWASKKGSWGRGGWTGRGEQRGEIATRGRRIVSCLLSLK